MKKLLTVGSALMLLSTSAFATQSRLIALGLKELDNEGSYYIQDNRNIFLNAAAVNDVGDSIIMEYGASGRLLSSNNTSVEQLDQPKAQGGFFKKAGDYTYGFYYGNESNTSSLIRIASSSAASIVLGGITVAAGGVTLNSPKMLATTDNQLDLFFAGSSGDYKWGTNLLFSSSKDDVNIKKDQALAFRLGVKADKWDAHLNMSVLGKAESTDTITSTYPGVAGTSTIVQESEGKLGVHVGGSYNLSSEDKIFGYVKTFAWEQKDSYNAYALPTAAAGNFIPGGQNGTVKGNFTTIQLGWGKAAKVNETGTLFTSVYARHTSIDLKFANKTEVRNLVVPVTIGYEAVATDWLTLRGSIVQNIIGTRDNKNFNSANVVARSLVAGTYGANGKGTLNNSTEVNAGATLTYGKLAVDGVVGITSASRVGSNSTTTGTPNKTQGPFALDNLASKVAVTYNF